CVLALASTINSQLTSVLFGERAETILLEAERRGFLTCQDSQYEFHPLLRQFLLLKFGEFDPALSKQSAEEICRWEVTHRNWDEALQLADRFGLARLLFD